MSFSPEQIQQATALIDLCRQEGLKLATAESCTGGLIAGLLTEIAGSSDVMDRGFVTYSNAAKQEMLGVPAAVIDAHGAVSREAAVTMAEGALAHSHADLAVSVTGIAGPGGGTAEKPVGLVHLAVALSDHPTHHEEHRFPDLGRRHIRLATVTAAFNLLNRVLQP